ncbi:glutamate racemase, partial [Rhodoferax sp.]|uniref:glutamate racemase n=1 Tax=Rhodoferax sp. TaxID=50421 RepID=UPI002619AC3C
LSVLKALRAELPFEDFVYVADSGHAPYGERDHSHVLTRARAITTYLLRQHQIKTLVIACNTATAAVIDVLRQEHPGLPMVGVEPALKPAVAASQTRHIGVLATRGTLGSRKFKTLLDSLAGQASFTCQPCDGLAAAIEHQDTTKIVALCEEYTRAMGQFGSKNQEIDSLVLGCTHYPFARPELVTLLPAGVQLIDNGQPVARQTRRVLPQLASPDQPGQLTLCATGHPERLAQAARRWLDWSAPVQTLTL